MAKIPTPRSFNQIVGDMMDALLSRLGLRGIRPGSPILSILEAAAQSDMRSGQDTFDLLNASSLDRATGIALDRIGLDEDLTRLSESSASGSVTVSDSSFKKKATKIYQGQAAPIAGTATIHVVDALEFPATGSIYIGRGTSNYEGPLAYSAKTDNGTYWTLTLTDNTRRFHNLGEAVILAQGGNRLVSAGSLVQTPQGNVSDAIQFATLYSATIPDGETEVTGVIVTAQRPGTVGNISANSINSFVSSPFTGASVTNPLPFSNGQAAEDDNSYRERIKAVRQSRTRGTALAIKTFTQGIVAQDENKRVTSASVVTRQGYPTTLYIDDGTGYEERSSGIAIEPLVDLAYGGEQYFQVSAARPVAKASVASTVQAPYPLQNTARLAVKVGGVLFEHIFASTDFRAISNATAYEVAASINSNPLIGFSARTSDSGTRVVLFAKADTDEDIQVLTPSTGIDANTAFLFPATRVESMRLYRNDRLLSKDGRIASLVSNPPANWGALTDGETLTLDVDGTGSRTFTFSAQDFIDAKTGFTTVSRNTLAAWVKVLNFKIPGITASERSGLIFLVSNADTSSRASLRISGGTLVSKLVFLAGSSQGQDKDYTLDRNTGQIRLEVPLAAGDRLSAGSVNTRSFLESEALAPVSLTGTGKLWFNFDGGAELVRTGINSSTPLTVAVQGLRRSGNRIRVSSGLAAFLNVREGDWAIAWDSAFNAASQGIWRVADVDTNGLWFEVDRRNMVSARAGHKAVDLGSNKILVTGGSTYGDGYLRSCEVYENGVWAPTGSMATPRQLHVAVKLNDGKVLVAGGWSNDGATDTCEIYNPATGTWSAAAPLPQGIVDAVGACFANDKVLIAGGQNGDGTPITNTYLYTPSTNTWATGPAMASARIFHTGTVFASQVKLLVAGGNNGTNILGSAEVYDSNTNTWSATANNMATTVNHHSACLISDGTVLIAGGDNGTTNVSACSIYDPATNSFTATGALATARQQFSLVPLSGGGALAVSGSGTATAERFTSGTWAAVFAPVLGEARFLAQGLPLGTGALIMGGFAGTTSDYTSTSEIFDATGNSFSAVSNGVAQATFNLINSGLVFARTPGSLQQVTVAAGSNLTASAFASTINSQITGAKASVYRTNILRVRTNSFGGVGSAALVATNSDGIKLQIEAGDAITNTSNHLASVEAGNSEAGTPSFQILEAVASESASKPFLRGNATIPSQSLIVGLGQWDDSHSTSAATAITRYGNNRSLRSSLEVSDETDAGIHLLTLRQGAAQEWGVRDRCYSASSYAIAPGDDLTVVVDQDTTSKRFTVPFWRRLTPVGSYGSTLTFKDKDNAGKNLGDAFGLGFKFDDFAVYMPARVKTHGADASKRVLWRYSRLGPDGNRARIKYVYPTAAQQQVAVFTDPFAASYTNISVRLPAGPLKTGYSVRNSTKIGVSAQADGIRRKLTYTLGFAISSATRTTNVTTLTLTMPVAEVTDHGLQVGDSFYLESADAAFSASGAKTITARTATTVSYAETAADGTVANLGTISLDVGAVSLSGATPAPIAVGDILTVTSTSSLPTGYEQTLRIAAMGPQFIQGWVESFSDSFSTTPSWSLLGDSASFQVFSLTGNTATAIAAAVNVLADATDSTCPVKAKVTGTGTGAIDLSSTDEAAAAGTWFQFTDGVNYIRSTTNPANLTVDFQVALKNSINGDLIADSDWANEDVRLVPVTTAGIVRWLNSIGVTGLSSVAEVAAADQAQKPQIASLTAGSQGSVQVQGGSANEGAAAVIGSSTLVAGSYVVVTAQKSDASSLFAGSWVSIDNTNPMPKAVFGATTGATSIAADGVFVVTSTPVYTATATVPSKVWRVEKQGRFVCFSHTWSTGTGPSISGVQEGDWVRVLATATPTTATPQLSSVNLGSFRVVRVQSDTRFRAFWIENANFFEEEGECDLRFLSFDSLMPGDRISISTEIWGAGNKGFWTVETVGQVNGTGAELANAYTFKVSVADKAPTAFSGGTVLGTDHRLVQVTEAQPSRFIKQIHSVSPSQGDGKYLDLKLNSARGYGQISATAGSVIKPLDKLWFSNDLAVGIDGYSHSTGLIGEANRVLYGDPRDAASYPGVIAAGANVNISGPLVKRISCSLSLRVRSGISTLDISDRVKSAVAAVVNKIGVGQPIAISDLVNAASKVNGVVAVSVISPSYGAGQDLISVQPYEKPLILNLDQDVTISFAGE